MATVSDLAVAVPIALGAAASFAVANVAQMRAARKAEGSTGLNARLLVALVRDPLWLLGFAASVLGFGLQATALFLAPVVLVQPLIVTELLFALPLAAFLAGSRLGRRETAGALLVAAGISCFVLVGRPSGQGTHVQAGNWVLTGAAVIGAVAVLVVLAEARQHRPTLRASLLAAAASVCFGVLSVLTKVVGHQFSAHRFAALLQPQPWMLAVVAIAGLLLAQTAFRIAPLSISLPIIDIGEPLIASVIAVAILGETIDMSVGTLAGVTASAAAVAGGIGLIDTSSRVRMAQETISAQLPEPERQLAEPDAVH